MARTPIWKSIVNTLTGEIAGGEYGPGDKLPTESTLAARFGVNRHTVRHALRDMAEAGLVHARRGAGVFVTQVPTDYPIGKRVRFHQNLLAAGRTPTKDVLSVETRKGNVKEIENLKLEAGSEVHVYDGLSLADGQPVALFRSVFPAERFPTFPADIAELTSVTAALAKAGVSDHIRISTRLTAKLATATQALHLHIKEGAPVLRTEAVNVDEGGYRVEYGRTWFAGDRITLTVNSDP